MAGIVPFAAVDCNEESNQRLCAEFDIKGFPTIKLMRHVNGRLDPRGTSYLLPSNSLCEDYNGPRTAKGFADFAGESMENLVVRVNDDNIDSFLSENVAS